MHSLVETLARRSPSELLIETPGRHYSVADVIHCAERLAGALRAENIRRLALLAENSADWIIADLACQQAEVCLLPLPVFFADGQLVHSIDSVGVDAILSDDPQRVQRLLPNAAPARLKTGGKLSMSRLAEHVAQPLPAGTKKITFTSGSTGAPRGVCLDLASQLRVAQALQDRLQLEAPRHLCLLPMSTLLENVGGIYWSLMANGVVMSPPGTATGFSGSTRFDSLRLIEALNRYQPTSIILFPQMLVGLVSLIEQGWSAPPALQFAAVGGARVDAGLLQRARDMGLPVYEGYGLSEAGSVCCLNSPDEDRIGSVGRPLAHVALTTEDNEIVIRGNAFLGYVGEPTSWGQQQVATGDLGRCDDDGFIFIEGRRKNLLISSFGRNVSPEWIESQLLAHSLVAQCVVLGDDRPYCTALIVPADPAADRHSIQTLIERVNHLLPDYARIHRWQYLPPEACSDPALFTDNGKPRRSAIARRFGAEIESLYVPAGVSAA